MRLICSLTNPEDAKKFCHLLSINNIDYSCEEEVNRDWGSEGFSDRTFRIWIYDEDAVSQAKSLLEGLDGVEVSHAPQPPPPTTSTEQEPLSLTEEFLEKKLHSKISRPFELKEIRLQIRISFFIILACIAIFLLDSWSVKESPQTSVAAKQILATTAPVRKALLYDYPESFELLDKIISLYGPDALLKPNEMPPPGKFLYETFKKLPVWLGVYPELIISTKKILHAPPAEEPYEIEKAPMFEKISQGEVWRLFSPAFLHTNVLHLLFNMLWVVILATQIETKIRGLRFIVLIALLAAISNTAQYLMSGPNFIGFSGVICGMATFIRTRQKLAPWEGYYLSQSTYYFILFFIGILALLSFVTFFVEVMYNSLFPIGVANTAHLSGAIAGLIFGRLRFFSWQPRNE